MAACVFFGGVIGADDLSVLFYLYCVYLWLGFICADQ